MAAEALELPGVAEGRGLGAGPGRGRATLGDGGGGPQALSQGTGCTCSWGRTCSSPSRTGAIRSASPSAAPSAPSAGPDGHPGGAGAPASDLEKRFSAKVETLVLPTWWRSPPPVCGSCCGRGRLCLPGPAGLRLHPAGGALRREAGPQAAFSGGPAAGGAEHGGLQPGAPCAGDRGDGGPSWPGAGAPTKKRPGGRPCFTTAQKRRAGNNSWPSAVNIR